MLYINFIYFQVDSTQDIGAEDQATLFLRYVVNSEIKERLFAVLKVNDSSGKGYFEILKKRFNDHGIDIKKIIGESICFNAITICLTPW